MKLIDLISVIHKDYIVTLEVYNKYGYETTYRVDLETERNILNPKYRDAMVMNVESKGKGKINIVVELDD